MNVREYDVIGKEKIESKKGEGWGNGTFSFK